MEGSLGSDKFFFFFFSPGPTPFPAIITYTLVVTLYNPAMYHNAHPYNRQSWLLPQIYAGRPPCPDSDLVLYYSSWSCDVLG